jgi:hypothetical protein
MRDKTSMAKREMLLVLIAQDTVLKMHGNHGEPDEVIDRALGTSHTVVTASRIFNQYSSEPMRMFGSIL